MKEIKYELNCSICLTKCPFLCNINVGSTYCIDQCVFYSHQDKNSRTIFCKFDELSKRKEDLPKVRKYQKLPEVVDAIQFTKDCLRDTIFNFLYHLDFDLTNDRLEIQYVENKVDRIFYSTRIVNFGDWIVKDEKGTLQIINDEGFKKRYKEK